MCTTHIARYERCRRCIAHTYTMIILCKLGVVCDPRPGVWETIRQKACPDCEAFMGR